MEEHWETNLSGPGRIASNSPQLRTWHTRLRRTTFTCFINSWLLLLVCLAPSIHIWLIIFLESFFFWSILLPLCATARTNSSTLKYKNFWNGVFQDVHPLKRSALVMVPYAGKTYFSNSTDEFWQYNLHSGTVVPVRNSQVKCQIWNGLQTIGKF